VAALVVGASFEEDAFVPVAFAGVCAGRDVWIEDRVIHDLALLKTPPP
jgi:hypothetical protein